MAMSPADVLKQIKDKEVKFVDLRFTDTRGKEQHVSVPAKQFTMEKFDDGHAFDGSSIAGWKGIEASDMLLMPEADTARLDPFTDETVLNITCDVIEPSDGKGYDRDPRSLAKRAEAYLKSMCLAMEQQGVEVEVHHHEVAAPGQCEIGTMFEKLVKRADWLQILKYTVWNVAHSYGKTATFMPKPIVGDNGSGMHVHQSIWKGGENMFAGNKYAGLSDFALYYIGGIIKHAKALNAITNPGTNSYKRLVPGFEAPINLAYSAKNRSASIRIPHVANPKGRRVEARFPDPLMNPYLGFAALMMA